METQHNAHCGQLHQVGMVGRLMELLTCYYLVTFMRVEIFKLFMIFYQIYIEAWFVYKIK